ncbi:MAG: hypothetical protein M2R45_03674 [Verrucomicrobia subdivision 3 bacterium]|nr:hypothetical protein [Limisphaerales bacterium]MCS1412697.1 hypothetical protein [Limisphaerales bacterium]
MQTTGLFLSTQLKQRAIAAWLEATFAMTLLAQNPQQSVEADNIAVSGQISQDKAQFTIIADLLDKHNDKARLLYTSQAEREIHVDSNTLRSRTKITLKRIQGEFDTINLGLSGRSWPTRVTGTGLKSWSVRSTEDSKESLVLEFDESEAESDALSVAVETETEIDDLPFDFDLHGLQFEFPALASGDITVRHTPDLAIDLKESIGLTPVRPLEAEPQTTLTESVRGFRFLGTHYRAAVHVRLLDPDALRVVMNQVATEGQYTEHSLEFRVTTTATTKNPRGASHLLLGGQTAITEVTLPEHCSITLEPNGYIIHLERPGSYPITFEFRAKITENDGWKRATFHLPTANLLPVSLTGFEEATEFHLENGGLVEAKDDGFHTFLPANGEAVFAWRNLQEERSSKLFYNTEALSTISIGTGVMRQSCITVVTVMQGELDALKLTVEGEGEITTVTGTDILSWELNPTDDPQSRELIIRFNRPQTESCRLTVSTLSTLGPFPLETQPIRITPLGSTRHHGMIEVVNEGAVRLANTTTAGLSRVSPPNTKADSENELREAYPSQRFAFRHSSTDYSLTIQADDIQPEITASALFAYHLGHDGTRIEADFELEIREAPIREYVVGIPSDYVIAEVSSHQLADFFITQTENIGKSELRLEFNQPVFGRQQIRLRLEKNETLARTLWTLSNLSPQATRQIRGHIGVSSVQGFRLTPNTFNGVSEIATVYFPKQTEGLQAAFRITDNDWGIALNATPIPQALQADCTHLYTIGSGLIYGSSLIQFAISGAPVDTLQFNIPAEYQNIEFTGEEVRNWTQTETGYDVVLQSPIIGPYTLLVSYERTFQDEADRLNATGASPLNTTSEQGTIILSSSRQIQMDRRDGIAQLIELAPEELSPEHRLLLSHPVLAVFQYSQRPFTLNLGLSTLNEGNSVKQIVDRAEITTRISQDGQTVTTAKYYVKSTGSPHFALSLPAGSQLWSATVDHKKVIPITADNTSLIPLGADSPSGELRRVEVSIAANSQEASPVRVTLPQLSVPMLYSKWNMEAAPQQRLRFLEGNIIPMNSGQPSNGFLQLRQLLGSREPQNPRNAARLLLALALLVLAIVIFYLSRKPQICDFRWRHVTGITLGALALLISVIVTISVSLHSLNHLPPTEGDLEFNASFTSPTKTTYTVIENRPINFIASDIASYGWPVLLAALLLGLSAAKLPAVQRPYIELAAWLLCLFGVLSWPIGGPISLLVIIAFLIRHLVIPGMQAAWRAREPISAAAPLLITGMFLAHTTPVSAENHRQDEHQIPDRVEQQITIENGFAAGKVTVHWNARAGQWIPLLHAPGVLTQVSFDATTSKLSDAAAGPQIKTLMALQDGLQLVQFDYQIPVDQTNTPARFQLPTQYGLINRIDITLAEANADLTAPQAISTTPTRPPDDKFSYWTVIPKPTNAIEIEWQPRQRNRSEETPVYFAEIHTLLVPSSGLVEGFQDIAIRPAQGEVSQINVAVPSQMTINGVLTNDLSQWRFEPENGRLKIDLNKPQSQPFLIRIRSQWITGPLPYTATLSFPTVESTSGQVGTIGIATGVEAQLSNTVTTGLVPIDPQDFRRALLDLCRAQFPNVAIRRAFRYNEPTVSLELALIPVAPHITVTTNERLSIGEDRTLLATTIEAQISRAGIFNLSFILPAGMNIDSVSGNQLSHWTQAVHNNIRTVTLHLKRKYLGALQFELTLSGPGISPSANWVAPKVTIQESNRQRGQLLIVPEQGVRLQPTTRDNVSQFDPRARGVKTNGAQAFDLLNAEWNLAFSVEQVAPWIEVATLQDIEFTEGKANATIFLDFQIKNTAVKSLNLSLPDTATNVRFEGEHIADSVTSANQQTSRDDWTVRFQRRVIGNYRLTITYQTTILDDQTPFAIRGVILSDSSLQRSFLALRTQGRLQTTITQLPASLYMTDWHNVPRHLRRNLPDRLPVEYSFRAVSPDFQLPVTISRHQITQTLAAQINQFDLTTIVSQDGSTITKADIAISPGSKRSLEVSLPSNSEFWFARVNGQTVSALTNNDNLLIPFGHNFNASEPTQVEVYIQDSSAQTTSGQLDNVLRSINLDLPADSVTWTVYLDQQWDLKDWEGDLQLTETATVAAHRLAKLEDYLTNETSRRQNRTKEAEALLERGNRFLQQGNEVEARHAFQGAYNLTQHDAAFNEDARVQLRTLKTRQAMAGITVQQNKQSGAQADLFTEAPEQQLSAQNVLGRADPSNENLLLSLANRLVQQQDETASAPRGFDVTLPVQGKRLKFLKSVQVDSLDNVTLRLQARSRSPQANTVLIVIIAACGFAVTFLRQKLIQRS